MNSSSKPNKIIFKLQNENKKKFVSEYLKTNGMALEYINQTLKNDQEIVMTAIEQNPLAIQYADETIRKNENIVKLCIKKNAQTIKFVHDDLMNDINFIEKMIHENVEIIMYFDEKLKQKPEVSSIVFELVQHKKLDKAKDPEYCLASFLYNNENTKKLFEVIDRKLLLKLINIAPCLSEYLPDKLKKIQILY